MRLNAIIADPILNTTIAACDNDDSSDYKFQWFDSNEFSSIKAKLFSLLTASYNGKHFVIAAPIMDKEKQKDKATDLFAEIDITALHQDMLRFATLQLRDHAAAEDAVQEALSAAYASRDRFAGKSHVKTWVFSILRNKIIDVLRERTRRPTESLTKDDGSDTDVNELFNDNGFWHKQQRPSDWGEPEAAFNNDYFWHVLEICLNAMADNTARVFTMREFLGLETAEICTELEISESNCWVILHRARSQLRLCLEGNWIKGSTDR